MNSIIDKKIIRGHMGKTVIFDSKKDQKLFMKDFLSQSSIQEKFSSWNVQGKYDTKKIIFEEILKNELVVKGIAKKEELDKYDNPLENLHKCLNDSKKTLDDTEQNQVSVNFYDISEDFKKEYIKFLKSYVANLFLEPIYFQEVPTFRFHFPFQKGYEWEDRYHTDIMLGHPPYEYNVWIPFTQVYDSNSMRITPLSDSLNFYKKCNYDFELFAENVQYNADCIKELKTKSSSLNMNYGDFIVFDPRCLHCTQNNRTEITRISLDIRIITESSLKKYSREYKTTGRKKMLFQPGHYFSEKPISI
jgi:sporadic carbohydrate cluster 2OG-Fe(II) oxygenase